MTFIETIIIFLLIYSLVCVFVMKYFFVILRLGLSFLIFLFIRIVYHFYIKVCWMLSLLSTSNKFVILFFWNDFQKQICIQKRLMALNFFIWYSLCSCLILLTVTISYEYFIGFSYFLSIAIYIAFNLF